MKLFSNFKDYYDYLIAKYGIDNKCVYERICSTEKWDKSWIKSGIFNPEFELETYRSFSIHFCGLQYFGHYYDGKFYYGESAKDFIPSKIRIVKSSCKWGVQDIVNSGRFSQPIISKENEKQNCPVIYSGKIDSIKNPKLSDFQFSKCVPPEDAFLKITNFILREPVIDNNQTDKEKVVSHGFDLRTSFRH